MIKEALSVATQSNFYQQLQFFKPEKEDRREIYRKNFL